MVERGNVSLIALAAAIAFANTPATAQELASAADADRTVDTIIVTGTRRTDRTVTQSATPVDVYSGKELVKQGSADLNSLISNIVPSFTVGRFPISDGSTFVRPPNLRGLPPDETLVLVNGKRRHRAAVVQLSGGSLASGSQPTDLAQIPAIAIDRLEVLRDGSSAQYGSDAIAGVINVGLKSNNSGVSGYARYGQYYKGDGKDYQAAINSGFKLGDSGFLSVSGEYVNAGTTSRGATRPGALALQAAFPNLNVPNPVQLWGNPKLEAERVFANGGFDLGDGEIYFFGNYGHSSQEELFNYRQPVTVTGPDQSGKGTTTFRRSSIFNPIYLTRLPNGNYSANGSTFSFTTFYPAGFTPHFFGKMDDISIAGGYKGKTSFGVSYDLSAVYGQNEIKYSSANTLNPSMGPNSPTSFYLGSLKQSQSSFNADFTYDWDVGFASPVTLAWGAEYRREAYRLGLGDSGSYTVGPYANQTVQDADGSTFIATQPIGANGFPGFGPSNVGASAQNSYGLYLDVETDVTKALTVGGAIRHEHYDSFGGTTNVKGKFRYAFGDVVAVRGAASTGFRAPTPGQVNTRNVATTFPPGVTSPIEIAVLPASDPAAIYYGAVPVQPEKSVNLTGGIVFTPTPNATLSIDYYNIKVKDRIGTSQAFTVSAADRNALRQLGVVNYASLGQVQYLTNAFSTRTQGLDIVGTWRARTDSMGTIDSTLGFNWNKTKITSYDSSVFSPLNPGDLPPDVANMQSQLPRYRVILTENWTLGRWSVVARANYHSKYTLVSPFDGSSQDFGGKTNFDLEVSYEVTKNFTLTAGGQNIFDTYPDKDRRGGFYASTASSFSGQIYPYDDPFGFNGGFWYVRAGYKF